VTVDEHAASARAPGYQDRYEAPRSASDTRAAIDWFRAAFEGAPTLVRSFLVFGWRFGLGLRLGSRRQSADLVLGWRIDRDEPDDAILTAESRFMTATLEVRLTGTNAVWSTTVDYVRAPGRLMWLVATPIHHIMIPYRLRAASRI
jgi:Protein of unknown function (DUF2867)